MKDLQQNNFMHFRLLSNLYSGRNELMKDYVCVIKFRLDPNNYRYQNSAGTCLAKSPSILLRESTHTLLKVAVKHKHYVTSAGQVTSVASNVQVAIDKQEVHGPWNSA